MRTQTRTVSLVSSLVAAALVLAPVNGALAAPEEGDAAAPADDAEAPESDDAEVPEGEDAEAPEGDDADTPEGEDAEGDPAEGEDPEGEAAEGEDAEGDPAEGEDPEGEAAEGEDAEGEAAEGDPAEGEAAEGEDAEGEAAEDAAAEPPPPVYDPDNEKPDEPLVAGRPATGKGLMIAGGTVAGVGLAMTITFALITRRCSYDGPLQCRLQNQDRFLIPMGAATLLTGAMLLGVGVGYAVRYKRWQNWSPQEKQTVVVPTTVRGGGGLAVVGRF